MLKNYTPAEHKTEVTYEREFLFPDLNGGYGFDCDENGNVFFASEDAKRNYDDCLAHPEKFEVFNKLRKRTIRYKENAHGTCECGREVTLWNEYYGACECECGRWYNLFGQELNPPEYWED